MRLLFNVILIFMLASPCYAFEKSRHELFSNDAIDLYKACKGRVLPQELSDAFVVGSVEEDTWGWTRARNWHYYNRENKIGRYWKVILCNGSNDHIFHVRLARLNNLLLTKAPERDIYDVAGRLAHHIQDMSSPPHVMPINHLVCDKMDHYRFRPASMDPCEKVNVSVVDPPVLLREAAQYTIKATERPVEFKNGTIENETWMKFWGGPDDAELSGFKTYGGYGNVFGVRPQCKNGGVCDAYDKDVYDNFYADRYRSAVTYTVRLLIYLDQRMSDYGRRMQSNVPGKFLSNEGEE